jgi:hypothetical protein
MTKDEALRLAIETLCCMRDMVGHPDNLEYIDHQVAKIEAALEAKDEPDHSDELTIAYMSGLHRGKEVAQRTWVGLTDKEVENLCLAVGTEAIEVRLIEAKLKEKNT